MVVVAANYSAVSGLPLIRASLARSGCLQPLGDREFSGRPSRIAENSLAPVWSPDGKSIAFTTARDGGLNLAVMRFDDSTPSKTILVDGA